MNNLLSLIVYMAAVTWLTLLGASLIRAKAWTAQGLRVAMGNRDKLPEATPLAGRAQRTARNTLENFIRFAALALTAHADGQVTPGVVFGAQLFFWSRLFYIGVYYLGLAYVRTAIWLVGVAGLALMALPVLGG